MLKEMYKDIPMSNRKNLILRDLSLRSAANLPKKNKICSLKNLKNTFGGRAFCTEHKGIKNARNIAAFEEIFRTD